ncbi:MAG TPA: OmpA family protein [Candidatus Saccharimonadales bacterium]|nr:OmpA family protein [Candidatus Saccharimonadales bacterium]
MLTIALLLCLLTPATAQSTAAQSTDVEHSYFTSPNSLAAGSSVAFAPAAGGDDFTPAKIEVFLGYSWLNSGNVVNGFKNGVPRSFKLNEARSGFIVDGTYFFKNWVGFTVDAAAHFGNNYDANEFFAGPTFRYPSSRLQPFAHFLVGWSRLSPGNLDSDDSLGFAIGGGLDLRVHRHLSLRVAQADYVFGSHDFRPNNPSSINAVRLSAGLVILEGVGDAIPPSSTCSVNPSEVFSGEPVKVSVAAHNFDPKHSLKYEWTTNGGKVQGQGETVTIDTAGAAEGQSFTVSVHVTDSKNAKAQSRCQTQFATKRWLPPTISCSASPSSVEVGGKVAVQCSAGSPQGVPVTVASNYSSKSTPGTDFVIDTTDLPAGQVTVASTATDTHNLTASTSTNFTVRNPPPPPPPPPPAKPTEIEVRLSLHSVYFVTAQPTAKNPDAGLVASQAATLASVANDFKNYLETYPKATLVLEAHADPRGTPEYNLALTERRAARAKKALVERGIPAANLETKAFGEQRQLSDDEVKRSVDNSTDLTPRERARIVKNMKSIQLASNRRVDITLSSPGRQVQQSVRSYPFNAADSLTLIGGREKPAPAVKPAPRKKKGAAAPAAPAQKKAAGKKAPTKQ